MSFDLNKFCESVFNESRTTIEFKNWWFNAFSTGDFRNKKVSAKIDFFPLNTLFNDFEDHFTEVLYDPSEEKLPSAEAQKKALATLRTALKVHFEDKINQCEDEGLLDDVIEVDSNGKYNIPYDNVEMTGPRNSMSEFVMDIDKETKNGIKGSLIRTYKLSRLINTDMDWMFNTPDGRVESYSNYNLKVKESPYVDDLHIDTTKDGKYTEEVGCHFTVNIILEEPTTKKGDNE